MKEIKVEKSSITQDVIDALQVQADKEDRLQRTTWNKYLLDKVKRD